MDYLSADLLPNQASIFSHFLPRKSVYKGKGKGMFLYKQLPGVIHRNRCNYDFYASEALFTQAQICAEKSA